MLTAIVPFYKGNYHLPRLLDTLPADLPVIVVDDQSPGGINSLTKRKNVRVVQTRARGYFGGAVNRGFEEVPAEHDVLVLNQDVQFKNGDGWLRQLKKQLESAGLVGDFVKANAEHPNGYVQGTFMGIRADVREKLGNFDAEEYPHWGVTCLYQMRACRQGFKAEPLEKLHKWMLHARDRQRGNRRYGAATQDALVRAPESLRARLIRTPLSLSVIIPCYNKAEFIEDAVNSVLKSSWQDFEIIIVEDKSTDESRQVIEGLVDSWKYVRAIYHDENKGVVQSRNDGVAAAHGDLIFQLDADDMVANRGNNGLERMVNVYRADSSRWVYTDLHVFGNVKQEATKRFPNFDSPHPYAIGERNVAQASILYPKAWWKEVGGYHPESERGHDDWCFAIALTNAGHCGQHLQSVDGDPLPAVLYRELPGSRNKTSRRRAQELREMKRRLWPNIFKGYKERVDMAGCCGGRSRAKKQTPAQVPLAPGTETIEVVYVGTAKAAFPKRGRGTGTRYTVRPGQKLQIYDADVKDFLSGKMAREYRRVNSAPAPAQQPTNGAQKPVLKKLNTMQPDPVPNPSEMTLKELRAWIADLISDARTKGDVSALRNVLEQEKAGKGRKGAIKALQESLDEAKSWENIHEVVPA